MQTVILEDKTHSSVDEPLIRRMKKTVKGHCSKLVGILQDPEILMQPVLLSLLESETPSVIARYQERLVRRRRRRPPLATSTTTTFRVIELVEDKR